jgi:hypothetical protein
MVSGHLAMVKSQYAETLASITLVHIDDLCRGVRG